VHPTRRLRACDAQAIEFAQRSRKIPSNPPNPAGFSLASVLLTIDRGKSELQRCHLQII
jgi:hypothetical protein